MAVAQKISYRRTVSVCCTIGAAALSAACSDESNRAQHMQRQDAQPMPSVTREEFGRLPDGTRVDLFTLANGTGMEVRAIEYGGVIVSLEVPDREGNLGDVVLGFDSLQGYLNDPPYFGAIVGRYGNRIAGGRFTLDGRDYRLAANNGTNHLHGGNRGFDKVLWHGEEFRKIDSAGVVLTYTSPDGEEGYPGTLSARVTYTLTSENKLVIDYHATTDRPTHVNLTHHSYFNLAGDGSGDVLRHQLMINGDHFTPVDATLIPTGSIAPVRETPFDFSTLTAIGARIEQDDEQLGYGLGYDHNFVLNRADSGLVHAAQVYEPTTGRVLDIHTTEPGIQFYSGNFLDGSITGKAGHVYQHRFGFCLETQHYPDSPNRTVFPSTVLQPGSEYRSRTVYSFSVRR